MGRAGMSGVNSSASSESRVFLTEDLMMNILLRVPIASCIARFRCVCRSWRALFSDPQFIRRFLFFQNSDDLNSLQILFTGGPEGGFLNTDVAVFHYSLHSYDTLGLISAGDLPSVPSKSLPNPRSFSLTVVGCCDGIFCIADANPGAPADLLLWNPATSETKLILPRTTCPHPRGLEMYHQVAGFGYDPATNDYKVVRIVTMDIDDGPNYHFDFASPPPQGFLYAEVYSLRNDSWKKLIVDDIWYNTSGGLPLVHQQREVLRNHKCYWFSGLPKECGTLSFDMSQEVFEYTAVARPPAVDVYWGCHCCFMLKESFVAFFGYGYHFPYQVWGLLKQGVRDSWTKLLTIAPMEPDIMHLEAWKEGAYICADDRLDRLGHVYISCPETSSEEEREVGHHRVEIRGRSRPFQALYYKPTQVSLSHLE